MPLPLDPVTWNAPEAYLAHRVTLKTSNPHVIVTKGTKLNSAPASHYYMTHVLDGADLTPTTVRNTRLADLAASLDPSKATNEPSAPRHPPVTKRRRDQRPAAVNL